MSSSLSPASSWTLTLTQTRRKRPQMTQSQSSSSSLHTPALPPVKTISFVNFSLYLSFRYVFLLILITPGCISRSASLTMTPWSPRPLSPSSSSPESVSPPPRPPPPANYEPSDLYCSLPRNWRERKHFLFDS